MKVEMKNQNLALVIREEREKRNLTQEHLAHLAELSPRTIQRLECDGTHSKETLMAVAEAFEVDCKELLRKAQELTEKVALEGFLSKLSQVAQNQVGEGDDSTESSHLVIKLLRRRSGKAILDVVACGEAVQPDYPADLDPAQSEVVGWLFDYINDLAIFGWSDITPSSRLRFEHDLSDKLSELTQLELGVFAGAYDRLQRFREGEPSRFRITVCLAARFNDPRIVRLANCEEFVNAMIPSLSSSGTNHE